ncbi:MAG: CBS domain-containing protein [Deltaproteobacteria bacterium]
MHTLANIVQRNLVTVLESASLEEASKALQENLVSGLGVVDRSGELTGVVSVRDLMMRSEAMTVAAVMTPLVFSVDIAVSVRVAARLMTDSKLHRLFVEEDGKVVGIVTLTDIARLVARVGLVNDAKGRVGEHELSKILKVDRPREAFRASLLRCGDDLVPEFHRRLMESSASARAHFANVAPEQQRDRLGLWLSVAADAIDGKPDALAALTRQAERYERVPAAVTQQLHDRYLEALVESVRRLDPRFSPAIEESWRVLIGSVIGRIVRSR